MTRSVTLLMVGLVLAPAVGGCTVSVYDNPSTAATSSRAGAHPRRHRGPDRPPRSAGAGSSKPKKPGATSPTTATGTTATTVEGTTRPDETPNRKPERAGLPDVGRTGPTRSPGLDIDSNDPPRIRGSNAFGNGRGGAFKGAVFAIAKNTDKMPNFDGMRPFATLFRDVFDTLPGDFKEGFPGITRNSDWFGIRYEGVISIPSDASYRFRMASDDGGILYVDDDKLLDNDGVHLSTNVWKEKVLTRGLHRVRLDYFHTTGNVSLMVWISKNKGPETLLVGTQRR